MRIAIDARPASHTQPGGFKSYTEQLLRALAHIDVRNEYFIYYDRAPMHNFFNGNANFQSTIVKTRVPSLGVIWREQVAVTQQAKRNAATILHFTANTCAWQLPCPTVVTLHDVIFWEEHPTLRGIAPAEKIKRYSMYLYGRWAAKAGIRQARRLITVSQYSRQKILERFNIAPQHCVVVHNGLSEQFRPLTEQALQLTRDKYPLHKPFILGMTSASPRKNGRGLLDAYQMLDPALRDQYELVLVLTHGLLKEQMTNLVAARGLSAHVRFFEHVSDDDLVGLMNLASTFVFPSLEEGFGMPPLEAMACGTPVVASNRSSLPEILGDAALSVDPTDTCALAQGITGMLTNASLAHEYRERGLKWAARYSWAKCAQETIQVYQEASRGE
jgi:glycosyltransferase involved in cell wall biosynthesis